MIDLTKMIGKGIHTTDDLITVLKFDVEVVTATYETNTNNYNIINFSIRYGTLGKIKLICVWLNDCDRAKDAHNKALAMSIYNKAKNQMYLYHGKTIFSKYTVVDREMGILESHLVTP